MKNRIISLVLCIALLLTMMPVSAFAATGTTTSGSSGGLTYKLYTPSTYKSGTKAPLVVVLHGCSQTADNIATSTQFNALAEKEGFLVLYPQQSTSNNSTRCWNWFETSSQSRGSGEPKIIVDMVNAVKSGYSINDDQVFLAGFSAGGGMASILGATYPDVFKAIGIGSGLMYKAATSLTGSTSAMSNGPSTSTATAGQNAYQAMGSYAAVVPTIVFHGSSDSTVSPKNATASVEQWLITNDYADDGKKNSSIDTTADSTINGTSDGGVSYTVYNYNDADGNVVVSYYLVNSMGHAWSGGPSGSTWNGIYTYPNGPDETALMWDFFMASVDDESSDDGSGGGSGDVFVDVPIGPFTDNGLNLSGTITGSGPYTITLYAYATGTVSSSGGTTDISAPVYTPDTSRTYYVEYDGKPREVGYCSDCRMWFFIPDSGTLSHNENSHKDGNDIHHTTAESPDANSMAAIYNFYMTEDLDEAIGGSGTTAPTIEFTSNAAPGLKFSATISDKFTVTGATAYTEAYDGSNFGTDTVFAEDCYADNVVTISTFDFSDGDNAVVPDYANGCRLKVVITATYEDSAAGNVIVSNDAGIYNGTGAAQASYGLIAIDLSDSGSGGESGGGSGGGSEDDNWEFSGATSTEGLVVDKTLVDNGDGTYTVTAIAPVTGSVEKKPAGAVYAEDLVPGTKYYSLNVEGDSRTLEYCETCGEWYITAASGIASYILTAYGNCATNHTYTGTAGTYVGTFIPVGKYSHTTENAENTAIQPITVWFFTSASAASNAITVSQSGSYWSGYTYTRTVKLETTEKADLEGLGTATVLNDAISSYFDYVPGSAKAVIQTYSSSGWANSGTLSASASGKFISVTGFDYSDNCYINDSGYEQGGQVVLTYKVTAGGATGIGGVFPVGTNRAGVYTDSSLDTMLALLPNPTVHFAREDDSNVEIKEQDGLKLEKTATDNGDGTYTVTLSAYVTGTVTEIDGTVYSDELDTSRTYFVYTDMTGAAMEVEYCSRCGEWWQKDTWHIYHYFSSREAYKFVPRTEPGDTNTSHDQFFATAEAANEAQGGTSTVTADLALGTSAVLEDYISNYFILDGSVGVYTSYYNGSYFSAFANSGLTAKLSADGSTITVSGFDFAANAVAEGTRGGDRLVVTFNVVPKDGVLGTVPTNGVDSGIYNGGVVVAHFPRPTVNVVEYTGSGDVGETPEMNLSGLELDKALTANGDGTYSIDLEAFTSGQVTTTNGVPLDVVFVLDRSYEANNYTMRGYWSFRWFWPTWNSSSSYSTGMMKLAQGGIADMIMTLQADAKATGTDHRVSLITYAGEAELVEGLTNVSQTTLINAGDEDSGKLWNVTAPGENTGNSTTGAMTTDNGNGSHIDLALQQAVNVFGAETDSSRKKVVIVLTGSIPGDGWGNKTWGGGNAVRVANDALAQAQILKDMGIEIYTVGLYNNANAFGEPADAWAYVSEDTYYNGWMSPGTNDYKNTNRFLHFLSSDLTTGITNVQATISTYKSAVYDWTAGYYGGGDTVEEACVAFEFINNTVVAPVLTLDGTTILKDQVTKYFDIVGGLNGIQVSRVPYSGGTGTDITDDVTVTLSDGIVSVSGYDYGTNNVNTTAGTGNKLRVSFDIKPKDGFVGGNNVPTNVAAASGAYIPSLWCDTCQSGAYIKNGACSKCGATTIKSILPTAPTANFGASPEANVAIKAPKVIGTDAVIYYGDSVDGVQPYHSIDTVTDGWKYDYVNDIRYSVLENISNTACGTYTVQAIVTPKYTGGGAVGPVQTGESSTDTAEIHVLTPHITVRDTVVYKGTAVDLNDLVTKGNTWRCVHGESGTGDTSNVVVSFSQNARFTATACTEVTVSTVVSEDTLATTTLEVHVLEPDVVTEDRTIYLSQKVDLTEIATLLWDCSDSIADVTTQADLFDVAGDPSITADNLTFKSGGSTIANVSAYDPETCSTIDVSGTYNGESLTGSMEVHVLQPNFTVTTNNLWADYGVEVDLEEWGIDSTKTTLSWSDTVTGHSASEDDVAEGTTAPEVTISDYIFTDAQGNTVENDKYITGENDATFNVKVKCNLGTFEPTDASFKITINKFDLVISKKYDKDAGGGPGTNYDQDVIFKLTDQSANKSIRVIGEADGTTKVSGLICGKEYKVSEEIGWSWRYLLVGSGTYTVTCSTTGPISTEKPTIAVKNVEFENKLNVFQWMSKMIERINLFK